MTSPTSLPRFLAVAAAVALALVAGCDTGPRSAVEGTVTYDGQPVDVGGIAFIPIGSDAEGRVRATGPIKDGHYELDSRKGPLPGNYRVEITWQKKTGKKVTIEFGHKKDETVQVIPDKYNTKSELTVEIKPGRNTLPFDLNK